MTPKIYVKSMKNQSYVADAFLERFGAALGCQTLDFGIPNLQNITKIAIEIDPKSMENRGCVFGTFSKRFWEPKVRKSVKIFTFRQGGPKIEKFNSKASKSEPKGTKSEPKGAEGSQKVAKGS